MSASLEDSIRGLAQSRALPWGGTGPVLDVLDVAALAEKHGLPGHEIEALALNQDVTPARYLRNRRSVSREDQIRLLRASVALVGLGGLGGSLLEQFLRLGIGRVRAADGDLFEASNLNRQALSTLDGLGREKTRAARLRAEAVNPSTTLETRSEFLTTEALPGFLDSCALAVDALGGLDMRGHLQRAASRAGIPLVTGALAGWSGYVAVVMPGQLGPADLMGTNNGGEEKLGCPAPAVNLVASLMASEVVNVLTGAPTLAGRMLLVDLRSHTFETVSL
ncbi:Sulfur carrier protein ThiS adenylyltransferase [Pseudodesulfovibrio hydrargyri]|uniref:Sulfur carrier protein ThiS adenylyltransferase n=1 Tax=Pseudodesulfovibrio hydrargyri TaxID=2125990 RepID=A0A1J5MZ26_9BACT|nr:ThiF family adenylyltransferase [Pseudodesulfovibrio hydrargyri]OIQ51773.1 Sulfur carrier protein ThiS adenylyltransferase [Pseudodesulfovibrio hydrargyri]